MKNGIKNIVVGGLLLAATSATAGLLSSPMGIRYASPQHVPVSTQASGDGTVKIQTDGLIGELTIEGSDLPPEYDIATTAKLVLPFEQKLELLIDIAEGTVSGRSTTNVGASSPYLAATAEISGNATCLPLDGRECGQMVVDLELQGVVTDPNDPSIVGQLRKKMLGSLVWDDTHVVHWAAMSAKGRIVGNEGLISSVLQDAACHGALVIC